MAGVPGQQSHNETCELRLDHVYRAGADLFCGEDNRTTVSVTCCQSATFEIESTAEAESDSLSHEEALNCLPFSKGTLEFYRPQHGEMGRQMKPKSTIYWISTGVVTLVIGVSGGMSIAHATSLMKELAQLGYPPYFAKVLGIGKAVGLIVLLAPGLRRFKEWAYSGFSITILAACYSHFSSGNKLLALDPLAHSPLL